MSRLNNGSIQWLRRRKRSNRVDISLDLKLPDLRGQLQSAIYQLRPNQNQTFRGLGLSHAKRYIRVESTWLVKAWLIKKTKKKAAAAAVVVCIFWGASVCKYKRWEGLMGRGDSASRGPARHGEHFKAQAGSDARRWMDPAQGIRSIRTIWRRISSWPVTTSPNWSMLAY